MGINSSTVKGRRVQKPSYIQYAILISTLAWAFAVIVLSHRCNVLANENKELLSTIDCVQDKCLQLQQEINSYRDLLLEQDATDGIEESAPVYVFSSTEERDLVERVVMSEAGNQSLKGIMAVAQCVLNTAEYKGISAGEVVSVPGQYTEPYEGVVNDKVIEAVRAVFDRGETVVDEPIMYFYAYKRKFSNWHENSPNLEYVCIIEDHKFFKLAGT